MVVSNHRLVKRETTTGDENPHTRDDYSEQKRHCRRGERTTVNEIGYSVGFYRQEQCGISKHDSSKRSAIESLNHPLCASTIGQCFHYHPLCRGWHTKNRVMSERIPEKALIMGYENHLEGPQEYIVILRGPKRSN